MKLRHLLLLSVICLVTLLSGCQGRAWLSKKPPFHPNPNMDWQAKNRAQSLSLTAPEGTVLHSPSVLKQSSLYATGRQRDGALVTRVPVPVDSKLLTRGQDRYNIYCATCHDKSGSGNAPVIKRGFVPPPHLATDQRLIESADGYLFDVITNGVRNMPAYRKQISIDDSIPETSFR